MAEELPPEVIGEILKYLKLSDRLIASTVCLAWYEASLTPNLWKDAALSIESSVDNAASIFKFSRKPIQHVKIKDVNFSSSTQGLFEFWENISSHLLSLEIHKSYVTEANLLNLLIPCSSLESLHFHDCRDTFITGKLFKNDLVLSHIKQALPNLRELCFSDNGSYLSDAFVDRFMSLVHNLKYLSFSGTSVSFHPGISKKFYPDSKIEGGSKSSELVLTFDCIFGHIVKNSATVKYLDFSRTPIDDKACLSLSKIGNLKLHSLLLRGCEVSSAGVIVLCGSLPTLTELDVGFCARVTDTAISTICKELPSLRKLSLQNCRAVTDEGISLLSQLSCLEDINLQGLERMTSLGVEQGLLSRPNKVLKRINLSATRITEDTLRQLATNSPNLTHLDLTSCVKAVTITSLQDVWKSLRDLRELRLDWCVSLTDDGFKESTFKDDYLSPAKGGALKQTQILPAEIRGESFTKRKFLSVSELRGLNLLSVSGCNKITDQSLQEAFAFRELRHLDLNACSLITDTGLTALSEYNHGLEVLILNYCNNISDSGMIKSISSLPRLQRLGLLGCLKLTNLTVQAIGRNNLQYLSSLDVSHCKFISLECAFQLQLRKPSLRELGTAGLD